MQVIVCGAGQVGYNICKQLAAEQHDVTVVDTSAELIQKISDSLDVRGIVGFASHPDVLDQAGANDADMVIAVTLNDEVNMIACQVAHSLFSVPTKIARVRTQSYLQKEWLDMFSRDHLPIDVIISPELEVARAVMRRLEVPGAFETIPFADDKVSVVGVNLTEDCPVVNTPLRQLTDLFPDLEITVVGIVREGRMIIASGDDQMMIGDSVYFVSRPDNVQHALNVFGHEEEEARRVIVIGGGNIGLSLAREIEQNHPRVKLKLIEADKERAEYCADHLERVVVLNGDGLDDDVLREANVQETETIVALTNDDEVNVLTSVLAKRAGAKRSITLINNPNYRQLNRSLNIDVSIDPRNTTVSRILQHIRRGRIRAVHSLADDAAEIIEAEALETSSLVGKPLKEANLPDGMVIGAVVRDDEVIIPRGSTEVKAGDQVIIFVRSDLIKKVERMFRVSLEFF